MEKKTYENVAVGIPLISGVDVNSGGTEDGEGEPIVSAPILVTEGQQCYSCKFTVKPGMKFCLQCGASVAELRITEIPAKDTSICFVEGCGQRSEKQCKLAAQCCCCGCCRCCRFKGCGEYACKVHMSKRVKACCDQCENRAYRFMGFYEVYVILGSVMSMPIFFGLCIGFALGSDIALIIAGISILLCIFFLVLAQRRRQYLRKRK